jgi:hypothetical protein
MRPCRPRGAHGRADDAARPHHPQDPSGPHEPQQRQSAQEAQHRQQQERHLPPVAAQEAQARRRQPQPQQELRDEQHPQHPAGDLEGALDAGGAGDVLPQHDEQEQQAEHAHRRVEPRRQQLDAALALLRLAASELSDAVGRQLGVVGDGRSGGHGKGVPGPALTARSGPS